MLIKLFSKHFNFLQNYILTSGFQIANFLLPLASIPLIVRVVGVEKFGTISYAQAFISYFTLLINYSFDFTATRDISVNRANKPKLAEIFYNVIYTKSILFIVSTCILVVTIIISEKLSNLSLILIFTHLMNIGMVFFPSWYFQGIEKFRTNIIINFASKLAYTLAILLLLKTEEQYYYTVLIFSICHVIAGLIAFFNARKSLDYTPKFSLGTLFSVLNNGKVIFLSAIAVNVYTATNTLILGFLTTDYDVGIFTSAQKLINIIVMVCIYPLSLILFPKLALMLKENVANGIHFVARIALYFGIVMFLGSAFVYFFSEYLITLLYGTQFLPSAYLLRIMSFVPLIIFLNNLTTIQIMLNCNMNNEFLITTLIGAVFSVSFNWILVPYYGNEATSYIWVITELIILIISSVFILNKKLKIASSL